MEPRVLTNIAAVISKHGHEFSNLQQFANDERVIKCPDNPRTQRLISTPHASLQKFGTITVIFSGFSRRFLAQITRHQNEIKFMSSSMHYGDHSDYAQFLTPIEIMRAEDHSIVEQFECATNNALLEYQSLVKRIGTDAAGYVLPLATRTLIMAGASPFEWKHIIGQRTCHRNTHEMRIAMLLVWLNLYAMDPVYFAPGFTGPECSRSSCREPNSCCNFISSITTPGEILREEYPEIKLPANFADTKEEAKGDVVEC